MAFDEQATIETINQCRAVFRKEIAANGGRVVDMAGDSVLAIFDTAIGVARAAMTVQAQLWDLNTDLPDDRRMLFRIGLNTGDIHEQDDGTVYGDGINIAARIESKAIPGGICVSDKVHAEIEGRLDVTFADLGRHEVKNISRPVQIWRLLSKGEVMGADRIMTLPKLPDKPSIVVLPFDNMSGDAEQEYFSDGITEDILTDISKVSGLFVISRGSAFVYKGKAINVGDVGRDVGVRYVLQGSVRKAANRVRVTAQLTDCHTSEQIWAERYDRDLDDIFAVQDEVTREIVAALSISLSRDERSRIESRPTESMAAHDLFLRARELGWQLTRDTNAQTRSLMTEAVALDPGFADAIAVLAATHIVDYINRWGAAADSSLKCANELAEQAITLGDGRLTPHFVMSIVDLWQHRHERALDEIERCLAIAPNSSQSASHRGHVLYYMGRAEEALKPISDAMRHDPLLPDLFQHFLAQCHFALGDFAQAAAVLRRRIELRPHTDISRVLLASALGHLGQYEEARETWRQALAVNPDYSLVEKRAILPYRDPTAFELQIEGLRMASLDISEN